MSRLWRRIILLQSCALVFLAGVATDRGLDVAPNISRDLPRMALHPITIENASDATPEAISKVTTSKGPSAVSVAVASPNLQDFDGPSETTIGGGPEPTIWAVGIDEKDIRAVIERWCLAGGYQLIWSASVNYPVPAAAKGHSYNGDLMAAIAGLAKTFGKLPTPLSIKFDPKAGILRVASSATAARR